MMKVNDVERSLRTDFDNYWSLFFMSGESDSTSHEWARSQMIEVSEALFWVSFEKPKKIHSVDRFVISEWLERIRSGREYYESKEDLLLLLAFACRWPTERVITALRISKSTFYFRLFHAMRLRSTDFRRESGHLSAECAHFDLRLPEYLVLKVQQRPIVPSLFKMVEAHAKECTRCQAVKSFSQELAETVHRDWNQVAPFAVVDESMQPFVEAQSNPVKKNLWSKMPPWFRTLLAVAVVVGLAYVAFKT